MKYFLRSITLGPWAVLALLYAAILVGWAGPEAWALPRSLTAPLSTTLSCISCINAMLGAYFQLNNGISK